jgi:hypothetical protein
VGRRSITAQYSVGGGGARKFSKKFSPRPFRPPVAARIESERYIAPNTRWAATEGAIFVQYVVALYRRFPNSIAIGGWLILEENFSWGAESEASARAVVE